MSQQPLNIRFNEFCEDDAFILPLKSILVSNTRPGSSGNYNGSELDLIFDRFKWTAQLGKTYLPDPIPLCHGSFCGVWLIDDFELYGDVNQPNYPIIMEVSYKLACCPCDDNSNGNDLPGGGQIGNGNE